MLKIRFSGSISSFLLTKYFNLFLSEENIWKLCDYVIKKDSNLQQGEFYVVFISNKNRTVKKEININDFQ